MSHAPLQLSFPDFIGWRDFDRPTDDEGAFEPRTGSEIQLLRRCLNPRSWQTVELAKGGEQTFGQRKTNFIFVEMDGKKKDQTCPQIIPIRLQMPKKVLTPSKTNQNGKRHSEGRRGTLRIKATKKTATKKSVGSQGHFSDPLGD